jgi:hypothetical protein
VYILLNVIVEEMKQMYRKAAVKPNNKQKLREGKCYIKGLKTF